MTNENHNRDPALWPQMNCKVASLKTGERFEAEIGPLKQPNNCVLQLSLEAPLSSMRSADFIHGGVTKWVANDGCMSVTQKACRGRLNND